MGKAAQQILSIDKQALIKDLNRAYADEWCAHYNYLYVANTISGQSSPDLIRFLADKSARALEQANRFASRICQLGERPVAKLKDLLEAATDKPFKLPDRSDNVPGTLKAVLDAERTAIRTYKELYDKTVSKDPVTQNLVVDCLTRALTDEDKIERFLGDQAPEMTGR
jgi:bacterioferritin